MGFGGFPWTGEGLVELLRWRTATLGPGGWAGGQQEWTAAEWDGGPWTEGCGSQLHLARGQSQAAGKRGNHGLQVTGHRFKGG